MNRDVIVIGGGPAGILAAGTAASMNKNVILIEKNDKLGKKMFITGKGRCNITNNSPIEDFFPNIMTNYTFMYSGFYSFTNLDILNLLGKYGLETKVERGNRVFPLSDKSSDVIKALTKYLNKYNVEINLGESVLEINNNSNKFEVITNKNTYFADSIIISTGGKSYPTTGSTGDGYRFAKKFNHNIIPLRPSLIPVETDFKYIKEVQGLSLKNVSLSAYVANKKLYDELGEMIFTHYGISGPLVLSMSTFLHNYTTKDIDLYIDLKPGLDKNKLDERIIRDFEKFNNKDLKNSLDELLPQKLIPIIIAMSEIDENKKCNQITKEERLSLVNLIKGLPMKFKGFRPIEEAIVTCGGVSTLELNPSTMESKLVKNLFFAGEVIDVDGLTGGYNLQIAYSTGYLAGLNA